ncbi:MAG: hypothetical protein AAF740_00435 [Bacteroidota bacterium]
MRQVLILLTLTVTAFLFLGCAEEEAPPRRIGFQVSDAEGVRIGGAEVEVYTSEEDFNNDENAILQGFTDQNGELFFEIENSDSLVFFDLVPVYISVSRDELNNWTREDVLRTLKFGRFTNIVIQESLQTKLAGRNNKVWDVVNYTIDGNPVNGCTTEVRKTFRKFGTVTVAQTPACGGRVLGGETWRQVDFNSFRDALGNIRQITRFTGDQMTITYNSSGFIIREDHVLVE